MAKEKRYDVFVSSTFIDNEERRKAVIEAIEMAGMNPVGMERFTADTGLAVDYCRNCARDCDLLVGIVAWRYGWIPPGHDVSITELEYNSAKASGKPRLMFLRDPALPVIPAKDFDPGPDSGKKQALLEAFKQRINSDQMPGYFSEMNLGIRVIDALNKWRGKVEGKRAAPPPTPPPPPSPPEEPRADMPREPSPIWNVPLSRNEYFTGREQLLDRLDRRLKAQAGPAAVTQAIAGLGGLGKTQFALEYAWRHADEYKIVWWVRAETSATLAQDYADLARALELPEAGLPDLPEKVKTVRNWLHGHNKWLLIFDNVTAPEDLKDYLPTKTGHTLITSRHPEWTGVAEGMPIDVFTFEEATSFLQRRTGQTDEKTASELADALGRLPLALEQAASYCNAHHKTLVEYLTLLENRRADLLKSGKPIHYEATVATTWEINFAAVEKENPAAAELLNLIAFFAPERIPLNVIKERADDLPERLKDALRDDLCCDELIASLVRYSLVRADGGLLFVHRLVQEVVRDRMAEETRKVWAERAVTLADNASPYQDDDPRTWIPTGEWLPHALAAVDHASKNAVGEKQSARVLNQAGLFQQQRAAFAESKALLERAVTIAEKVYGPDHPNVAIRVNNLGLVLKDLGDLPSAKKCIERALEIDQKVFGPDHPDVATLVNNLGIVLHDLGDLPGAKNCFERALAIDEKVFGPDHPDVAIRVNNLGGVLRELGDLPGAKNCLERALAIFEKVLGGDHPNVATLVNNLGSVLKDLGDLSGAKKCFEHTLAIFVRFLGEDHPNTKIARKNLEIVEAELRRKGK